MTGGGGMNAVGLVEVGTSADALKQERNEGRLVFFGDGGKYFSERAGELGAHFGWHLHPNQHEFRRWVFGSNPIENLFEVRPGNVRLDAAETIIAAEREYEDIGDWRRIQSTRRAPPEVVSPLRPALTTCQGSPAAVIFFCMSAGYDSSAGSPRPYPAVRLSPKNTIVRGSAAVTLPVAPTKPASKNTQPKTARHGRKPIRAARFAREPSIVGFLSRDSCVSWAYKMSGQTMLKVEQLTKTYDGAGGHTLTVLREVSFEIATGASLAIVGPSGSGKTTLLGLCAGLDQPTTGQVVLAGESIGALDEDARARVRNAHVGFVFQNFQLVPTLTALENVMVPLELRGEGGAAVESGAKALLARVGLSERCDHYPVQLSGGEQQRVALARAFMNRPKILFCDEPTGNLDDDTAAAMVELIFEINRERGTTLVLVTHNLELAGRCHRIIRLRGGAVISDSSV